MKISVVVKTGARKDEVTLRQDGSLLVRVNAQPIEGKANKRVLEVVARYLRKPKSSLVLVAGHKSKQKIIEVR